MLSEAVKEWVRSASKQHWWDKYFLIANAEVRPVPNFILFPVWYFSTLLVKPENPSACVVLE